MGAFWEDQAKKKATLKVGQFSHYILRMDILVLGHFSQKAIKGHKRMNVKQKPR